MKKKDWFNMVAAVGAARPEIYIYDDIGMGGIYADEFVQQLNNLGNPSEIDVRISSRGGSVIEGVAIYAALARHPANIFMHIDGIAASIASLIMLAGNHISISNVSQIMVHQAATIAAGNADDFSSVVEQLNKVDAIIVAEYVRKTGKTTEEIQHLLKNETFMNADEALDLGFVDEVVTADGEPQASNSHKEVLAYLASLSSANKNKSHISSSAASAIAAMTASLSGGSDHRDHGKGEVMNKSELIAKLLEVGVDVTALEIQASQMGEVQTKLNAVTAEVTAMQQAMGKHSLDDVTASLVLLDETRALLEKDIVAHQRTLGVVADDNEATAQAKKELADMSLGALQAMNKPLAIAAKAKEDFKASDTDPETHQKRRTARKTKVQE